MSEGVTSPISHRPSRGHGVAIARLQGLLSCAGQGAGETFEPNGVAFHLLLKANGGAALVKCGRRQDNDRCDDREPEQNRGLAREASKHVTKRTAEAHSKGFAAHARIVDAVTDDIGNGLSHGASFLVEPEAGQGAGVTELDQVAMFQPFR